MATFDSQIRRSVINFSQVGDNIVVPAVVGLSVKVVGLFLVVNGGTSLTFKNGPIALTGPMAMLASGAIVLDDDANLTWFVADTGNNLIINSSAAVQVSGTIYFMQN